MVEIKSCGFLILRREPELSFLLMRHVNRLDLPKGHVDAGESELECALRELVEETGITADDIEIDPTFRFTTEYTVHNKRLPGGIGHKTLVVFLAWLRRPVEIRPTEHPGFEWFRWQPPHAIQPQTIDLLLAAVEQHLQPDAAGNGR